MKRATSGIVAAVLLHSVPALACGNREYNLLAYTKGYEYEVDSETLYLEKEGGTSNAGGCFDCSFRRPYRERMDDLKAKKEQLRRLRQNAQSETKAKLKTDVNDAGRKYNDKLVEARELGRKVEEVERQLRNATTEAQRNELRRRRTELEEQYQKAVNELEAAKNEFDKAKEKQKRLNDLMTAIIKELSRLQAETTELAQARNSCKCPPNPEGTIGQCR